MTDSATTDRLPSTPQGRRSRHVRRLTAATVVAGLSLAAAGTTALVTEHTPTPTYVDIGTVPAPQDTGARNAVQGTAAALPVRIRIHRIGVDSALIDLQVQPDGHLGTPEDPAQVGWWSDGPRPGDPGAAIVVGHVDSTNGPAAFYGISALRPGDSISVERADHSHVDFTVQALRQYAKDAFPDGQVYATTGPPELRLITCGGTYNSQEGGYLDNVVVYATLATPSPPHLPARSSSTSHRSPH